MSCPDLKLCGLTRPRDAAAALAGGIAYAGVIRYPRSPRYVSPDEIPDLLDVIPRAMRVAVDVEPSVEQLYAYREEGFHCFQIHFRPEISRARLESWSEAVGPDALWLAPRMPAEATELPEMWLPCADTWLIDTPSLHGFGGTGRTGDWTRFRRWREAHPEKRWALAGGLGPANLESAVREAHPDIVDVSSGVEASPGVKDPAKLDALFAALVDLRRTPT